MILQTPDSYSFAMNIGIWVSFSCSHELSHSLLHLPQPALLWAFWLLFFLSFFLWELAFWLQSAWIEIIPEHVFCYRFQCKTGSSWEILLCCSLQAIRTGWVHPNLNLENPEDTVVSSFSDAWFNFIFIFFLLLLNKLDMHERAKSICWMVF